MSKQCGSMPWQKAIEQIQSLSHTSGVTLWSRTLHAGVVFAHRKEFHGIRDKGKIQVMLSQTVNRAFCRTGQAALSLWQSYHKSNICIINDSASQVTREAEANYLCIFWQLATDIHKPYHQECCLVLMLCVICPHSSMFRTIFKHR